MNFLDYLRNNPHGWGPTGPAVDPMLQYDRPGDETWRGFMARVPSNHRY